jgi:uncharacterized protein YggE
VSRKIWITFAGLKFLAILWVLTGGASSIWAGPAPEVVAPAKKEGGPVRTITVIGEGRVSVRPDVARANVGVLSIAPTVKEAVAQNRSGMMAVLAALKQAGIAEKDILTSNYSIHHEQPPPDREGGRGRPDFKGRYHVNNMALVTIRDMDKVDAVLDAVTGAGVNQIWGVNFVVDNTDSVSARAREMAVAQARTKAEELARAGGVRLGQMISISEDVGGRPVPMGRVAMMEASGGGPISAGELTFSAQVQVVYGME